MNSIVQDVRYALRGMRRQPLFSAGVIGILSLAIGLNTSLFTVFNAVALRPWPVPEPDRVATVHSSRGAGLPLGEYRYLAAHSRAFVNLVASRPVALSMAEDATPLRAEAVSSNYFTALMAPLAAGRSFSSGEASAEAVISYGLWQRRFGSDASIIGRDIRVNGVPVAVIGIAAESFAGTTPDGADLWLPYTAIPLVAPNDALLRSLLRDPDTCCWNVAGRLRPGETRKSASAEIAVLSAQFRSATKVKASPVTVNGTELLSSPQGSREVLPVFTLLFAGVALILLLACANAGNLLLSRAAARRREIAVRLAAGAGRIRLVRQLLTESLVMALIAGTLGAAAAFWAPQQAMRLIAGGAAKEMRPDGVVLVFTLAASVVACIACGLTPALHATRLSVADALKGTGGGRTRARGILLGFQVAASIVLLVSAVLLARGITEIRVHDPGFRYDNVASVSLDLPRYDTERLRALAAQLELECGAGLAVTPPLGGGRFAQSVRLPDGSVKMAGFNEVNGRYFDALSIPFRQGRNFEREDASRRVAIVNESLARLLWPGESAIGKRFTTDGVFEVIGVVRDAYTDNLDRVEPTFYIPFTGRIAPSFLVRGTGVDAVQAAVARTEPRAVPHVTRVSAQAERWVRPWKVSAALAGGLGGFALVLSGVGIFGVFSYAVRQQTREIAIRMAIGAQPKEVVRTALLSAGRPVFAGLAAGLPGAFAASYALRSTLYGTGTAGAVAYALVVVLVIISAAAAAIVPARAIARVDPIAALRDE